MRVRNRYVHFSWLMTVLFSLAGVLVTGTIACKSTEKLGKIQVSQGPVETPQKPEDKPKEEATNEEDTKEDAIKLLQDAEGIIEKADPKAFRTPGMQKGLLDKYDTVMKNVETDNFECALRQLEKDILLKIDGCIVCEVPDEDDWIIDCKIQRPVYNLTEEAREIVKNFALLCCVTGNVYLCNPPAPGTKCTLVNGGKVYFCDPNTRVLIDSYTTPIQSDGAYFFSLPCGTYDIKAVEPSGKIGWKNNVNITTCPKVANIKIYR